MLYFLAILNSIIIATFVFVHWHEFGYQITRFKNFTISRIKYYSGDFSPLNIVSVEKLKWWKLGNVFNSANYSSSFNFSSVLSTSNGGIGAYTTTMPGTIQGLPTITLSGQNGSITLDELIAMRNEILQLKHELLTTRFDLQKKINSLENPTEGE